MGNVCLCHSKLEASSSRTRTKYDVFGKGQVRIVGGEKGLRWHGWKT